MTEIARLELGRRRPDGSCEVAVVNARGHRHKGVLADPELGDDYLAYLDSAGLDRPAVTGTGAAEPARPARAPVKPHPPTIAIPVSKLAHLVATAAGAVAVFGCFALDGPQRCSGLPAARYGPRELAGQLGSQWTLIAQDREQHITPAGAAQPFTWAAFRRQPGGHHR